MKPSIAPLVQQSQKQVNENCEIKQGLSLELLSKLCTLAGRTADALHAGHHIISSVAMVAVQPMLSISRPNSSADSSEKDAHCPLLR